MNSDQALQLVDVWAKAKSSSSSLRSIVVESNGNFNVEVGAAGFRFNQKEGVLFVSGFVASGQKALVNKIAGAQVWDRLVSFSAQQPATLGDGQLELYTGTADPQTKKPAVYLTRIFSESPRNADQFILEVNWLVRWANYWRDEGWRVVFSARTPEQLNKEAQEAQLWAMKKHPRPW